MGCLVSGAAGGVSVTSMLANARPQMLIVEIRQSGLELGSFPLSGPDGIWKGKNEKAVLDIEENAENVVARALYLPSLQLFASYSLHEKWRLPVCPVS